MKILMTGGSGKLGSIIRDGINEETFIFDNYDLEMGDDIFDVESLRRRLEGVDAVIHLAAIPHPFHRGKTEADYWRLNLLGTQIVFQCAASSGVKRFLFASSGCVYGFWGGCCQPDQFPILETNFLPGRKQGQTVYGETKIASEQFLEAEAGSVSVVVLRIESPAKNHIITEESLVTSHLLNAGGLQTQGTLHRHHFWACVSKKNFIQLFRLSLANVLPSNFLLLNTGNGDVDSRVDHHAWIAEHYKGIPNYTAGKDSLISIKKATDILGYTPESVLL